MKSKLPIIKTIDDIIEIEKTPIEDRLPFQDTYSLLKLGAENYCDNEAVIFLPMGMPEEEPVIWTYKTLIENINKFANYLHGENVSHDEAISVLLPNLPDTYAVLYGAEAQGIVNPVNPLLEVEHIAGIIKAAGGKTLVTIAPVPVSDIWQKSLETAKLCDNIESILTIDMAKYYPFLPKAQDHLGEIKCDGRTIKVLDYDEVMTGQNGDNLESKRAFAPNDIASYFHTGGTTGVPKLAQHTHLNEAYMTWVAAENIDMNEDMGAYFCGLPLFHVNGFFVSGLIPFSKGATVLLAPPQGYRAPGLIQNFWKLVEKYKIYSFSGVPTIYAALIDVPIEGCDLSSLSYGICGAAPMPPELITRFQDKVGVRIIEGYGLTEHTCIASSNPRAGLSKIGSIGLPLPYTQVKIIKMDGDKYLGDCNQGEIGNLALKGPGVFPGYKEVAKNKGALLEDGWLNTGDLARIDKDGYIWLTGRAKDLIIRGGHNIDPHMIEDVLSEHEAVELAAAIGQPDARVGEVPVAYVMLRKGVEVSESDLLDYAKDHISERAACPNRVEIIETMPVTAIGKIFKPDLRHLATGFAFGEVLGEADIAFEISFEADPKRGDVAIVKLSDPTQAKKASELLGAFPVPFNIC